LDSDDAIDFVSEEEKIALVFEGKPQADVIELFQSVERHSLHPIWQLRTVLTICPALEYHQESISGTVERARKLKEDHVAFNILAYAEQEHHMLSVALSALYESQADLQRDPVIQEYLSQQ